MKQVLKVASAKSVDSFHQNITTISDQNNIILVKVLENYCNSLYRFEKYYFG